MSKTKELFENEMYGESLNSTDLYLAMKKRYEEEEFFSQSQNFSEKSSIFVTPVSENTSGNVEENKNNLINQSNEEDFLRNFMGPL